MTVIRHELRQGRNALAIWTASIAFLMMVCVFLFPEMKGEMDAVGDIFGSMGNFTAAFGMDRLNFGTLIGFYAIECGNVLGLGGAFFASLLGVSVLAKEEKDKTAEFLLTHPVSRVRVITEKGIAVMVQIVAMNIVILVLSLFSMAMIGEDIAWKEILLMHTAYFLLQVELAGICFGLSAVLRRGYVGIGLGLATVMYFLNLIANLTEKAKFLKYITPYGYCEGADIVTNGSLDITMILISMAFAVAGVVFAYIQYGKKDIH